MAHAATTATSSVMRDLIREVSAIVNQIAGIQLGDRQSAMVQNRLKKRISQLGLPDEEAYLAFLKKNRESEATALVSLLTTHHTYFFREFAHFEFLEKVALPKLIEQKHKDNDKCIRVWSAACSYGQEVYSLSMLLHHLLAKNAPDFTYEILGTDVDPESVAVAKNGVYAIKEIQEVPLALLGNHWAKGTGEISGYVKAKKSIRASCHFSTANLLEGLGRAEKFDLVFCRNVFIYFNPDQIRTITERLLQSLGAKGYLFVGISETLNGLGLPVSMVGTSIYSHRTLHLVPTVAAGKVTPTPAPVVPAPAPVAARPLRVMCVDDSPVILSLLKKILEPATGFQVVAVAKDGKEAEETLAKHPEIDVITLDIHMPVRTGLEFLQALRGKQHPPIVMVSSVDRADADLALKCLDEGAVDYIEKPALSHLGTRADEIRAKLRYAVELQGGERAHRLDFDHENSHGSGSIRTPERVQRWLFCGLSDRQRILADLQELTGAQPPAVIVLEGAGHGDLALRKYLSTKLTGWKVRDWKADSSLPLRANEVAILDIEDFKSQLRPKLTLDGISVQVHGKPGPKTVEAVRALSDVQVLLDETQAKRGDHPLRDRASDVVPATSFGYLSHQYLARRSK